MLVSRYVTLSTVSTSRPWKCVKRNCNTAGILETEKGNGEILIPLNKRVYCDSREGLAKTLKNLCFNGGRLQLFQLHQTCH